jgi:hypothetical protein
MNTKILLAFVGGLIVASGITYVAMRPSAPEPAQAVAPAQPGETAPPPASAPAAEPATAPETAQPAVAESPSRPAPKPSAIVARSSRPKPARSSHIDEPPKPATEPAPVTQKPVETASNASPSPVNAPPASTLAPPPSVDTSPEPAPPPKPHTVTIPAGTLISVRLGETLSTERSRAGDGFTATIDQPLIVDGFVIAERGSRARGRVVESDPAGRVKGLAQLGIELTEINTSDGQKVRVNTAAFHRQAEPTKKKDAAKVGIGAALGAAIGAIAGGGKGAAIGAGVGGAAGAGDVLLTRGKAVELPVETRISFRLAEPVTITEHLQ